MVPGAGIARRVHILSNSRWLPKTLKSMGAFVNFTNQFGNSFVTASSCPPTIPRWSFLHELLRLDARSRFQWAIVPQFGESPGNPRSLPENDDSNLARRPRFPFVNFTNGNGALVEVPSPSGKVNHVFQSRSRSTD